MDEQRNQSGGEQESGAGYGNAQQGGGMDSSGGTGSNGGSGSGDMGAGQSGAGYGDQQPDQSVQRSETIDAEDIEFEADADLIDDDDE